MTKLKKGDYVLATTWSDGDPRDQWAIGLYDGPCKQVPGRSLVVDNNGKQFRPGRISAELRPRQSSLKLATGCSLAKTRLRCLLAAYGVGKNAHAKNCRRDNETFS